MAEDYGTFFSSPPQGRQRKSTGPDPTDYLWAGPFAGSWYGSGVTMSRGYGFVTDPAAEEEKKREEEAKRSSGIREAIYESILDTSPVIGFLGKAASGLGQAAEWVGEKLPGISGFTNEAADFFNMASYSLPRGIADAAGGAIEFGSRLVGDQPVYGEPLRARTQRFGQEEQMVQQRGSGVGAFAGDIADDIAIALATAGAGTAALSARGGAWAAESVPGFLSGVARFAPVATKAQRAGAAAASVVSNIYGGTSQIGTGDVSPWQLAAQVAIDTPFDVATAGMLGTTRLGNIIGDAAVGAFGAGVSNLVPLAMQQGYGLNEYLASTALGAGVGTAIGVGTNLGRVNAQQALAVQAARQRAQGVNRPTGAFTGETPEEKLVRETMAAASAGPAEPAVPETAPGSKYVSDRLLRNEVAADEDTQRTAAIEQRVYVRSLIENVPAETLVRALDLEVENVATLTPEELQGKILNEWVYQAVNGKGIDGIEERLAQAGISGAGRASQDALAYSYPGISEIQPQPVDESQLGLFVPSPPPGQGFVRPEGPMRFDVMPAAARQATEAGEVPATIAEAPASIAGPGQLEMELLPAMESAEEVDARRRRTQERKAGLFNFQSPNGTKEAPILSTSEDGTRTVEVDADDIKTGVPPSVARALEGVTDENGNPISAEQAFYGPPNRPDGADQSQRATPEITLFKDPEDKKLYAIDGRSNLINANDPIDPQDLVVDPETGGLKRDLEGTATDAEKVFNKRTKKVKARVIEGDAETAISERVKRNPELAGKTQVRRQEKAQPDNAADQLAQSYASRKEEIVSERATAGDISYPAAEAKKAVRAYKKLVREARKKAEAGVTQAEASTDDAATRKSYAAMKDELILQAQHMRMQGGLMIAVEPGFTYKASTDALDDITNNNVVRVSENTAPEGHPLSELSPVKDGNGDSLTYDQVLQATYTANGVARADYDINTAEGVGDAWDKYSRIFPAKAWPAVATETKLRKLAELEDPNIERVAGAAPKAIASPEGVPTSVQDRIELAPLGSEALAPVTPTTRMMAEAKRIAKVVSNSILRAELPNSGLEADAIKKYAASSNAFLKGEPTAMMNVSTTNRSPLVETIADIVGMLPGELDAAIKAGRRDFGSVKVLEVGTKKQKTREDITASFLLDIEGVSQAKKTMDVDDLPIIGSMVDDEMELNGMQIFDQEVLDITDDLAVDVNESSLTDQALERGYSKASVDAAERVRAISDENTKFRNTYSRVTRDLAAETGIRPAAARLYVLRMISASTNDETFKAVSDAIDVMLTPDEVNKAQNWISDSYRRGERSRAAGKRGKEGQNLSGPSGPVMQLFDLSDKIGSNGLHAIRLAGKRIADIDKTVATISETIGVPKDVVVNLLDETVSPTKGIDETMLQGARSMINKSQKLAAAFSKAKDDFQSMATLSLVRQTKEDNAITNNPKTPKTRSINAPVASLIGTGLYYVLDDHIQDFEDDELYMGIPGSVWKKVAGNGGYAAAMFGIGFAGRNAVAPPKGSGWSRMLTASRDKYDRLVNGGYVNLSKLTPEQRRDEHLKNVYENMRAKGIEPSTRPDEVEKEAQIRESMYRFLGGETKIGLTGNVLAGLTYMSRVVPAFREIIGETRTQIQLKTKSLYEMQQEVADRVLSLNKRYEDARHVDAANEYDWRMTAISNMEAQSSSAGTNVENIDWDGMRRQVAADIKTKYFTSEDPKNKGQMVLDREGYSEYLRWQRSTNKLRAEHLKFLVAKSVGAPDPSDVMGYYDTLKNERELANAAVGAKIDEIETSELNYGIAKNEYLNAMAAEMNRLGMDKKAFDKYLGEEGQVSEVFRQALDSRNGAKSDLDFKRRELRQHETLRNDIARRMSQIEDLPRMIKKSQRDGYLPRPRNGRAKYVLRVEAEDVGINVRFELDDANEVNRQKSDILREIALRRAKGEYAPAPLYAGEKPALRAGVSPDDIGKMSDADLINLLMDSGKVYYTSYRQDAQGKVVKAKKEAKAIIARAINLIESGGSSESVLRDNTKEISSADIIDEIVTALDEITEFSVSQAEIKKALLNSGAYKQIDLSNRPAYEVNIGEVGRLAKRLLAPPNPNLTRRRNVAGYYNESWTPAEKMAYLGQQVEVMRFDITDGIARTTMLGAVDALLNLARKYNIETSATEWASNYRNRVAGMEFNDNKLEEIAKAERVMRQYIASSTLTINLKAALKNRLYGMAAAMAYAGQMRKRVYGAQKFAADGTLLEEKYFKNKLESDEFLAANGMKKFDVREGYATQEFNGWIPTVKYQAADRSIAERANFIMSMMVPSRMLEKKASTSPLWSAIKREYERLDLRDATFVGSMSKSRLGEKQLYSRAKLLAYWLQDKVERANNATSLLAFTDVALRQYGIADADFQAMSPAQQQETIMRIAKLGADGRKLIAEKGLLEGDVEMDDDIRRAAISRIVGEAEAGRRMTQGGYSRLDLTRAESWLNSVPTGILAQTFLAPVLRAMDLSAAMTVGAYKELKGVGTKDLTKQTLKALAPVAATYAGLMTLIGAEGTPFYADAMLALEIADSLDETLNEDEAKRQRSTKQRTEDIAGRAFERAGMSYQDGQKFMRMFVTEGLLQSPEGPVGISLSAEGSFVSGLMPAGPSFATSFIKQLGRTYSDFEGKSFAEALYRGKRLALGTQLTNIVDASMQYATGEKLDNFGNPVIDPITGIPLKYDFGDAFVQGLAGKSYSDVRTTSAKYEKSIPLYSEYDKMNYMRTSIKNTKYVRFGNTRQQEDAIVVSMYPEAARIERDIAERMASKEIKEAIKQGKKAVDDFLSYDKPVTEEGYTPREMVAQIQARGLYDPSGRNASKVKDALYGHVEDMYLVAATQRALSTAYGKAVDRDPNLAASVGYELPYTVTDSELAAVMSGGYSPKFGPAGSFALLKLRKMYYESAGLYTGE